MAKKRVGKFSKTFRQMAVDRLTQCDNIVALAKKLGISRRLLYTWREKLEPLEHNEGPPVNSREATLRKEVSRLKRVVRLMREDNLLAVQPRAFVVTTDSDHEREIALNLDSRLTLTGMNQLGAADSTYIRMRAEFVYLAVMLDAYSRKVVGWVLDRTLAVRLPISASSMRRRRT